MNQFIDTFLHYLDIPVTGLYLDRIDDAEHYTVGFVAEDRHQLTEEFVWKTMGAQAAVDFASLFNKTYKNIQFGVLPLPSALSGARARQLEKDGVRFRVVEHYDAMGKWTTCPFHESVLDCETMNCLFTSTMLQGSGINYHIDAFVRGELR